MSARALSVILMAVLATLTASALSACGSDDSAATSTSASDREAAAQAKAQAKADAKAEAHNEEVLRDFEKRNAGEAPTDDELAVEETASEFYEILAGGGAGAEDEAGADRTPIDTASFCDLMSEAAAAQTVQYAKVSSGIEQDWDCESAVEWLVTRTRRSGNLEAVTAGEILGVNARGDRATATVRFGDGTATSIALVKEDGEWKLAAAPLTGSSR